jgi:cytochrome c-type biogenesis protein
MLEISGIGVLTAFGAGLISFLSPCVLPLVPGYLSYIGEQSLEEMKERGLTSKETLAVVGLSLCFVLGFASVFIIFGASATAVGSWFRAYRYELNIIGGIIVILFGLFMTGLFRLNWLQRDFRFHGDTFGGRPVASYLLGVAFAFGWTPCIGPILGSILTVSATSGAVGDGAALLAIYSMGLGVPFVLAALFTDRFLHHARALRRHGHALQIASGVLLVVMGIAMVTGYLSAFSIWLLKTVPWLGELG